MNQIILNFGNKVKEKRIEKGFTQEEFASLVDIDLSLIHI